MTLQTDIRVTWCWAPTERHTRQHLVLLPIEQQVRAACGKALAQSWSRIDEQCNWPRCGHCLRISGPDGWAEQLVVP